MQQQNNRIINKTDKDITKQTKLTIISLAYTDSLSVKDLMELGDMLHTIADYRADKEKRL